jgi:hypothetical protein
MASVPPQKNKFFSVQEKFEYTKGVIRSHNLKDSQYNGAKRKMTKGQTMIIQNTTQKTKD